MTVAQAFPARLEALADLVAFTATGLAHEGVDPHLLTTVDFVLEELFTNVVKYGSRARTTPVTVQVALQAVPGGIEVVLTAEGVDDFDVTQAPQVDTSLPIEQRRPGGLGLHLIRRLVDSIEYEYQVSQMRSRVTFRKTSA